MKTLRINWIIVLATVLAVLCCMSMISCGQAEVTPSAAADLRWEKRVLRYIDEDNYVFVQRVDTIYRPGDTLRMEATRYAVIVR